MFTTDNEYFNIKDTLTCGQVFRFTPHGEGYIVFATDKCAYVEERRNAVEVRSDDDDFWRGYFDLDNDYAAIVEKVKTCGNELVARACEKYKGIRILNQSPYEALMSFIVSQNNNIPRIKSIIEKLCARFGEEKNFSGMAYHAFPSAKAFAKASIEELTAAGLGYRAEYVKGVAEGIVSGKTDIDELCSLDGETLKERLLKIKGVGNKVADCARLFGFKKTDAFPVDTWIEKLYHEDFGGTLTDRKKISEYFVSLFGEYSGLVQQYLFHAKRENAL